MNAIIAYIQKNIVNITVMSILIFLCCHLAIYSKPTMALAVGAIPLCILAIFAFVRWPGYLWVIVFTYNYIIMGLTRYINVSLPITLMFEMLCAAIMLCYIFRIYDQKVDIKNAANLYWLIMSIWLMYCIINAGNGITGRLRIEEWYKAFRQISVYPVLVSVIVALHAKHYSFIQKFLIVWGIFTLAAAAKGYYQKNHGFDQAEWIWLWTKGATTHLISTGVRYFSFFTDAANFGCGLGMNIVVYFISAIYTRSFKLRIFYIIVALAGGYGMLISGTRAALAVPIVGLAMYTVLCKNWKVCVTSAALLVAGVFILAFTQIGDSNRLVHRMRTAFNKEDASMNVRLENQKALKSYMAEAPFGIGLGLDYLNVSSKNKYYFAASTPPDSDWVNIWIHEGEIGLGIYLFVQALVLAVGSGYILFRIKRKEIRGPLTGMLCGCGGLFIASYANMVYFQFPNGPLTYTCLTLVFLGPIFDKQYNAEHPTEVKEIGESEQETKRIEKA
jgi:hypothetical protein